MIKPITIAIVLFINCLTHSVAKGQNLSPAGIRLVRISYLTSNLDSLSRSFIKKGFRIKPGKREPSGIFTNSVLLQDGSEIILETTLSSDSNDWRVRALKTYKNYISGVAFEVGDIDSLYHLMRINNISAELVHTTNRSYTIAFDSCAPLDIVFIPKDTSSHHPVFDSLVHHPNHVFRFDWVLLSASPQLELQLRKFFEVIGALKQHQGCCDYWRVGPPDDFCFFRFDPLPPKAKGKNDWISIEPDGIYFAY